MINKVYLKIKKIMKENYKSLIVLIIAYFIFTFPLPYYIYAGGGTININERIMIDNKKNNSKGSLNFAYVKELKGNVATCLLGLLILLLSLVLVFVLLLILRGVFLLVLLDTLLIL